MKARTSRHADCQLWHGHRHAHGLLPCAIYGSAVWVPLPCHGLAHWSVSLARLLIPHRPTCGVRRSLGRDSVWFDFQEGVNFAKEHGMLFIECSAKTKAGIQQAFEELVQKVRLRV